MIQGLRPRRLEFQQGIAAMRRRIAAWSMTLLLNCLPAAGAEFYYLDHDPFTSEYVGPTGPLVLSGEIVPGDYQRLLAKIQQDQTRFLLQNKVILASDGGDVTEAMRIASLLKSLYSAVLVQPLTGRCVSACFFIYAAAAQRETDGERLVGLNRPFIEDAASSAAESSALQQVRDFLRDNGVPQRLVEEMFRRASDDAYWLSADDVKSLGYKSQSFSRYLAAKCAWSDSLEREAGAGRGSLEDLKRMLECRARVTQAGARAVLGQAAPAKP
jgi:hypothetical protein